MNKHLLGLKKSVVWAEFVCNDVVRAELKCMVEISNVVYLQKEINFLHIDDLMKKGMSYKKAKETIEKINQLKKENEKRNIW